MSTAVIPESRLDQVTLCPATGVLAALSTAGTRSAWWYRRTVTVSGNTIEATAYCASRKAPPVTDPARAYTAKLPGAVAVTSPVAVTEARVESDTRHAGRTDRVSPCASSTVASSCNV